MKVLITGATGGIGGGALEQCLIHPDIHSVTVLSRRDLPSTISENKKLTCLIVKDFSDLSSGVLESIKDADAMIWSIGTNSADRAANIDYTMNFQQQFVKVMTPRIDGARFRYVQISGKYAERDQDTSLWFLEAARKTKGEMELRCLEFADQHKDVWETIIMKPGGVIVKSWTGSSIMSAILRPLNIVVSDELGACLAEVALHGASGKDTVLFREIIDMGRKQLERQSMQT